MFYEFFCSCLFSRSKNVTEYGSLCLVSLQAVVHIFLTLSIVILFYKFQINNKVTSVNLSANDLGNGGISFLGKMMVENESITELVNNSLNIQLLIKYMHQ